MESEPLITKFTQIIQREDGSEVRVIAEAGFGQGLHCSIDVMVHRRENENQNWILCSDKKHPEWRSMSVDDYINRGRSEMLQAASHGEILKAANMIGKPISSAAPIEAPEKVRSRVNRI